MKPAIAGTKYRAASGAVPWVQRPWPHCASHWARSENSGALAPCSPWAAAQPASQALAGASRSQSATEV